MIKQIEHVGIMVSNMDKSIHFYESIFNFKLRIRVYNNGKEIAFLSHDGLPIDKSFDKQLDAIKKEDSTKLKEVTDGMNKAFDLYLEGVSDVNDIYLKEIEDIAETVGK